MRLLPSISVVPLFREHRRYFYVNDLTSASQWEFPTEEVKEGDPKGDQATQTQISSQGDTKVSSASSGGVTGQHTAYKVSSLLTLEGLNLCTMMI